MTELTEPDDTAGQPAPEWPGEGAGETGQGITDPDVARSVAKLLDMPRLPAAEHEAIYNALHDDLLATLNSDPTDSIRAATNPGRGEA